MTASTRHGLVFGLLVIGLAMTSLIPRDQYLIATAARNAGYLMLNQAKAASPHADTSKIIRNGIIYLELATTDDHNSSSAWRGLGYMRLIRGEEDRALAAWRHSETMPAELLARGTAAKYAGDPEEALRWFMRAISVDPAKADGWLQAGMIHESRGEMNDALFLYKTGSQIASDYDDLFFRLGRLISRQPEPIDWATVLELADRAIARDRFVSDWNKAQAHLLRGDSLNRLGRSEEALVEYAWVVDHYPDEYWAAIRYGELTWQMEGDLDKAEQFLERAIELDSASKWAYRSLGTIYAEAGRQDKAVRFFNIVLSIDPNDQIATSWLNQRQ